MTLEIRDATATDMRPLHAIYAHHVAHGLGTFDEVAPALGEFEEKWRSVVASGLAWLVACENGDPVGYAYASAFRPRAGYRFAVEDSVYVRADQMGRRIGGRLLAALIGRCETAGARQIVAVIGDSGNAQSIALHRRLGFEHVGTLRAVGCKFGRWIDVVMMQRALNGGDASAPPMAGAWRMP